MLTGLMSRVSEVVDMFKNKNADNGTNNVCGKKIKSLRKSMGKTQKALADALQDVNIDISRNAIQQIESGERAVTDIELRAFAQFFSISSDALLGIDEGSKTKIKKEL